MLASEYVARVDPEVYRARRMLSDEMKRYRSPVHDVFGVATVRVLGVGVSEVYRNELVPAVLVEWPLPALGRTVFSNNRLDAMDAAAKHNEEYFWRLLKFAGPELEQMRRPVMLIGIPRPIPYASPGDAVHCMAPAGPGTFGVAVSHQGRDGLLTAGHVTTQVGAPAYDVAANHVGDVIERMCYERDRNGNPVLPGTDVADVAVVETHSGSHNASRGTQGVVRPWDNVTAYGAVTRGTSAIATVGAPFAGPDPNFGNWAETMLTQHPISAPGDSGAPVYNDAGEVVGQVVAGYPGVYSVVQDIDYLLSETGAILR